MTTRALTRRAAPPTNMYCNTPTTELILVTPTANSNIDENTTDIKKGIDAFHQRRGLTHPALLQTCTVVRRRLDNAGGGPPQ